ncbi:MAG: hypothetical protein C0501_15255 [Isosphaera sp.]|nr:hypothetical protein [Isosphaera sp.]
MAEQRNRYRGSRPWLRLGFRAADGAVCHFDLVADTGSAPGLILRPDVMDRLRFLPYRNRVSNLGELVGGWVRLYNPEFGVVETVVAYGNARGAELAARSHPDFVGLIGLPILRVGEYGGNATDFWFRYPPT